MNRPIIQDSEFWSGAEYLLFMFELAIIKELFQLGVNLIGLVTKIFSDFYYVKVEDIIFECKIREVLKKTKTSVLVGDMVRLEEVSQDSKQAAIVEVLPRKNVIPRPSVANIDKVIVVAALKEPEFDYIQLNRYLSFAKLHAVEAIICINKDDLSSDSSARETIEKIYNDLSYEVIFTSAKENKGIKRLKEILSSGICVLCGQSGVGKSSLLNVILPGLNLKTKEVSKKTARGTHTTRHTELIEIPFEGQKISKVADTPGFSNLKFDSIDPSDLDKLFDEIYELSQKCKYNDCLHIEEEGCNVIADLDNLPPYRYESYLSFLQEAIDAKESLSSISSKNEERIKFSGGKKLTKISARKREDSRKKSRQTLIDLDIEEY